MVGSQDDEPRERRRSPLATTPWWSPQRLSPPTPNLVTNRLGVRYFSVGVAETTTGRVIIGLPTLISPPPRVSAPELLVGRFDGLATAPGLEEMLPRFLAALLTGNGELTRYTSPSSPIVAVQPPPFTSRRGPPDRAGRDAGRTHRGRRPGSRARMPTAGPRSSSTHWWSSSGTDAGRCPELLPAPTLAPSETN